MLKISVIIPAHNEQKNIPLIYEKLKAVFSNVPQYDYELIFVDDGSADDSLAVLEKISSADDRVKFLEFSRNFGKEAATTAGLQACLGDAAIMIDADLQHPAELILEFIAKWQAGADVVIGLRKNSSDSLAKRWGGKMFYAIINRISETPLVSGATDFRLIDRKVINEFNRLTERQRITRGLLDWLGFKREFIEFEAQERLHGEASYSMSKLIHLALHSFVSHSLFPLKFAGYLGTIITIFSGLLGVIVFIERYILNDPLNWYPSGSTQLAIINVFLIGIVLACLGLIALYVGNINSEVTGRPLYVVRKSNIKK